MSADAQRKTFFTELDKLRREPKRIQASDVASIARQAGLPPHEALIYIQSFVGPGYQKPGEMLDALSIFISALCKQAKANHVLEYTSVLSLLTARFAESDGSGNVSYIAPYDHAERPLQILFSEKGVTGVKSITDLKQGAVFDLIVCAPPLGHRPAGDANADGFGGEIVRQLVPALAQDRILCWVTGRGAVFSTRAKKTLTDLKNDGLNPVATIDVPPGGLPATTMEGVVVLLRRGMAAKRLVGTLRNVETSEPLASAILAGPSRRIGPNWEWLDAADQRSFLDLEHARLLQQLKPRGRYATMPVASLLLSPEVEKADSPVASDKETGAFLFVPEYAGSRVTADLSEQTVQPKAIYRLTVDPAKANPLFLARLLNSPFGRQLRGDRASGATIQRVSVKNLLALELPIPDICDARPNCKGRGRLPLVAGRLSGYARRFRP